MTLDFAPLLVENLPGRLRPEVILTGTWGAEHRAGKLPLGPESPVLVYDQPPAILQDANRRQGDSLDRHPAGAWTRW